MDEYGLSVSLMFFVLFSFVRFVCQIKMGVSRLFRAVGVSLPGACRRGWTVRRPLALRPRRQAECRKGVAVWTVGGGSVAGMCG